MVKVDLKGLYRVPVKNKAGGVKVYYYAWRGGPRLEAEFGTPAFLQEFADHKNPLANLDKRKFESWITLYRASDEYKDLADSTKRVWGPWFDRIKDKFGNLQTRAFDRPLIRVVIKQWRNKWKHAPRTADLGKQVLSRIVSFALEEGALTTNMCEGVPNLYSADRADIIWTEADFKQLQPHASAEIWHAVRLARLTGLRQGDLLKLSWNHIKPHAIEFSTGKSRGRRTVCVPLTSELRTLLDTIPKRSPIVLTSSEKTPWGRGFSSSWHAAMRRSKLSTKDLHFHDLRGTYATDIFGAGFSIREIAEILGWSEDRVERLINRYVKRDEILKDRIRRMEKASATASGALTPSE